MKSILLACCFFLLQFSFAQLKPAINPAFNKVNPAINPALNTVKPTINPALDKIKPVATDLLKQKMLNKAQEKNLGNPNWNPVILTPIENGYIIDFEKGSVYYSEAAGIHAVSKKMQADRFSEMGYPLTDEMQDGTNRYQIFERVVCYYNEGNNIVRTWNFKQAAYTTDVEPEKVKRQGIYRVYMLGFTCNHPTNDDILERDGKGDEVYFTANSYYQNKEGKLEPQTNTLRTRVMGDVNNPAWIVGPEQRIRFGSKSALGGIKEGDAFPTTKPYQLQTPINRISDNEPPPIPFPILEAGLIEDAGAFVIVPILWEKDNLSEPFNDFLYFLSVPGVSDLVNYIAGNANDAIFHNGDNARSELNYLPEIFYNFNEAHPGSAVTVKKSIVGDPRDRPIGMYDAGDHFKFKPTAIKIGYKEAEQLIASNAFGVGAGIFKIDYIDDPALAGNYTLYFKIEKAD